MRQVTQNCNTDVCTPINYMVPDAFYCPHELREISVRRVQQKHLAYVLAVLMVNALVVCSQEYS